MTKKEILEILGDVFVGYKITEEDKSKFSRILINNKPGKSVLMVFTYATVEDDNGNDPNLKAVWYFSIYFNKDNHEIMIPTGMERDFCEDFLLLYNDVEVATSKVNEVECSIREVIRNVNDKQKLVSKYRDKKLWKLGII
jgi:hypothetical protein